MNEPSLIIQVSPDDEHSCYDTISIWATSGYVSNRISVECSLDEILELGNALKVFPKQVPDEYTFTPSSDFSLYSENRLTVRAYTLGLQGYCNVEFIMSYQDNGFDGGECRIPIHCQPSSLERLADLLIELSGGEYLELRWSPGFGGGELLEYHTQQL